MDSAKCTAERLVAWSQRGWVPAARFQCGDKQAQLLGGDSNNLWLVYCWCHCSECANKPELLLDTDEDQDPDPLVARERGQGSYNFKRTRVMSVVQFLLHSRPGLIDRITDQDTLEDLARHHVMFSPQYMLDAYAEAPAYLPQPYSQYVYLDDAMRFLGQAAGGDALVGKAVARLNCEQPWGPSVCQHGSLLAYDPNTGCYKFQKRNGGAPISVHMSLNFVVGLRTGSSLASPQETDVEVFVAYMKAIPGYVYHRDLEADIAMHLAGHQPGDVQPPGLGPAPPPLLSQGPAPFAIPHSYHHSAAAALYHQGAHNQQPAHQHTAHHHAHYAPHGAGAGGAVPYGVATGVASHAAAMYPDQALMATQAADVTALKMEPGLMDQGPAGPVLLQQHQDAHAAAAWHLDASDRDPRQRQTFHASVASLPPHAPRTSAFMPLVAGGGGVSHDHHGGGANAPLSVDSSSTQAPLELLDWHRIEGMVERNQGYAAVVAMVWLESLLTRLGFNMLVVRQLAHCWCILEATDSGYIFLKNKYFKLCKGLETGDVNEQRLVLMRDKTRRAANDFLRDVFYKSLDEERAHPGTVLAGLEQYVLEALRDIGAQPPPSYTTVSASDAPHHLYNPNQPLPHPQYHHPPYAAAAPMMS